MTAKVITFPKQFQKTTPLGLAIRLYTEEEVHIVLHCLNSFGSHDKKYKQSDLRTINPYYAIECIKAALDSYLLSPDAKALISYIMGNVVKVIPAEQGGSVINP